MMNMTICSWDVSNIPGLVVEGVCVARRGKDGHTTLPFEEIAPLVLGRMPL